MKLGIKKYFFSLQNEERNSYIGEYFKIVRYKNKDFIYYNSECNLKVYDSQTNQVRIVLRNVVNSGFNMIEKDGLLYLLIGYHNCKKDILRLVNNKNMENYLDELKKNDKPIMNYVYNSAENVIDYDLDLKIPINGIYLYKSDDGYIWNKVVLKPIMHRFISSNEIRLGEVNFDTMPGLIKYQDKYLFYGRLNTSRQRREIYLTTSQDLINWSPLNKIKILNPMSNWKMFSYYHLVPFIYKNELYGICHYFETIDDPVKYKYKNCCHLILKAQNLQNWIIQKKFMVQLKMDCPYIDRITNVLVFNNKISLYFRENLKLPHQKFYKINLSLV